MPYTREQIFQNINIRKYRIMVSVYSLFKFIRGSIGTFIINKIGVNFSMTHTMNIIRVTS